MSSQWANWQADDHDSDDEEVDEADERIAPKEALLFCVEVSPSMLAPLPGSSSGDSAPNTLVATFELVLDLMKRKVVTNNKDLMGLVLFNTQETQDDGQGNSIEHLMILQRCQQINVASIQSLSKIINKCKANPQEMDRYKPWDAVYDEQVEDNQLTGCIDAGLNLLKNISGTADGRIFLVTDNDDPFPDSVLSSRDARRAALTRADDAREMNYRVDPLFISRASAEREFEVERFYQDYFERFRLDLSDEATRQSCIIEAEDQAQEGDMFKALKESFHLKTASRRALFTIPFVFGPSLSIGIQGFSLVTETKKGLAIQVDTSGRNVQMTKTVVTYDDKDSGQRLTKKDFRPYFAVGGKGASGDPPHKVLFQNEEVRALKTLGMQPSLRLLGFTTLDRFLPEHQIKHAYFIHPYEGPVKLVGKSFAGSKRVFSSLLHNLAQKEKIGLGVFMPRATSTPIHVLIVPQEEQLDDNGQQSEPPGFHLLQLAFADDIRDKGIKQTKFCREPGQDYENTEAATTILNNFSEMTRKLRFPEYSPDSFPNPVLNHHYNCLQAIALKEELPEAYDDTQPRYGAIKKKAGPLIEEAYAKAAEHPVVVSAPASQPDKSKKQPSKRKAADGSDGEDALDEDTMAMRFREGKTGKVLVKDMTAYAKKYKLGDTHHKRKADLLEWVRTHLQQEGKLD